MGKKKTFISRDLGAALDSPSAAVHDLDERAYQYGEDHKKKSKLNKLVR